MKRVLMGMTALLTVGVSACTGSSASGNLPIYEVSWDGFIGTDRISEPAVMYVWGSPNTREHPEFKPEGLLVLENPDSRAFRQSYSIAFSSYGCFPFFLQPQAKQFYLTGSTARLTRRPYEQSAPQVPIELEVKPLDREMQKRLLNADEQTRKLISPACDVAPQRQ